MNSETLSLRTQREWPTLMVRLRNAIDALAIDFTDLGLPAASSPTNTVSLRRESITAKRSPQLPPPLPARGFVQQSGPILQSINTSTVEMFSQRPATTMPLSVSFSDSPGPMRRFELGEKTPKVSPQFARSPLRDESTGKWSLDQVWKDVEKTRQRMDKARTPSPPEKPTKVVKMVVKRSSSVEPIRGDRLMNEGASSSRHNVNLIRGRTRDDSNLRGFVIQKMKPRPMTPVRATPLYNIPAVATAPVILPTQQRRVIIRKSLTDSVDSSC